MLRWRVIFELMGVFFGGAAALCCLAFILGGAPKDAIVCFLLAVILTYSSGRDALRILHRQEREKFGWFD